MLRVATDYKVNKTAEEKKSKTKNLLIWQKPNLKGLTSPDRQNDIIKLGDCIIFKS